MKPDVPTPNYLWPNICDLRILALVSWPPVWWYFSCSFFHFSAPDFFFCSSSDFHYFFIVFFTLHQPIFLQFSAPSSPFFSLRFPFSASNFFFYVYFLYICIYFINFFRLNPNLMISKFLSQALRQRNDFTCHYAPPHTRMSDEPKLSPYRLSSFYTLLFRTFCSHILMRCYSLSKRHGQCLGGHLNQAATAISLYMLIAVPVNWKWHRNPKEHWNREWCLSETNQNMKREENLLLAWRQRKQGK